MAETKRKIPIPFRVKLIFDIKDALGKAAERGQGLSVEKLIAEVMSKQGLSRRTTMECIDAVVFSGYAKVVRNGKRENIKIFKKKGVKQDVQRGLAKN